MATRPDKCLLLIGDTEEYKVGGHDKLIFLHYFFCRSTRIRRKDQDPPRSNSLKGTEKLSLNNTGIESTAWVWMVKTNVDLQLSGDATIVLQKVLWLLSINHLAKLEVLRKGINNKVPDEGIM